MKRIARFWSAALIAVLLAGCGGGGADPEPAVPPTAPAPVLPLLLSAKIISVDSSESGSIAVSWLPLSEDAALIPTLTYEIHASKTDVDFTTTDATRVYRGQGELVRVVSGLEPGARYGVKMIVEDTHKQRSPGLVQHVSVASTVAALAPGISLSALSAAQIVSAETTTNVVTLAVGVVPPAAGQVLSSDKGSGLLAKVVQSTQQSDGTTSVSTAPAALSEVVSEFEFSGSFSLPTTLAPAARSSVQALGVRAQSNQDGTVSMHWPQSRLTVTSPDLNAGRLRERAQANAGSQAGRTAVTVVEAANTPREFGSGSLSAPKKVAIPEGFSAGDGTLPIDLRITDPSAELCRYVVKSEEGALVATVDAANKVFLIGKDVNPGTYPVTLTAYIGKVGDRCNGDSVWVRWKDQPDINVVVVVTSIKEVFKSEGKTLEFKGDLQVSNKIDFQFEPTIDAAVRLSKAAGVPTGVAEARFEFRAKPAVTQTLTIDAAGAAELPKQTLTLIDKKTTSFTKVFTVGPVPVVVQGNFGVDVEVSGRATGKIHAVEELTLALSELRVTLELDKATGNWIPTVSALPTYRLELRGEGDANASVEVALVPRFEVTVLGVQTSILTLRPKLEAELGIHGHVSFVKNPAGSTFDLDGWLTRADLRGGIDAFLYADLHALVFSNVKRSFPLNAKADNYGSHHPLSIVSTKTIVGLPTLRRTADPSSVHPADSRALLIRVQAEDLRNPLPFGNATWLPFKRWHEPKVIAVNGVGYEWIAPPDGTNGETTEGLKHYRDYWLVIKQPGSYKVRFGGNSSMGYWARQVADDLDLDYRDIAGAGIPDAWATRFGVRSATADDDGDGWSNLEEFQRGTNPKVKDAPPPLVKVAKVSAVAPTSGFVGSTAAVTLTVDNAPTALTLAIETQAAPCSFVSRTAVGTAAAADFRFSCSLTTAKAGAQLQVRAADGTVVDASAISFTITNDDSAAAVTYSFTPATRSINEGAGSVSFTLSRSSGAVAQTVYVSTTMTEGFTNSSDYTGRDNVAQVFAVGETSKTITINITNDTIVEPDETFGLIVQQNAADPLGTYLSKATFTITNDDSAAAVTYSFTPATRSINEGAGSVSFTLSRSSGAVAQTVYVSTTMTEGFTNSSDYTGRDNVAQVFAVGETSKTITINITNDTIVEPDETFGLIVQQNAADPLGTYLSKATFTITNDDSAAAVTYSFTPATRSINEGAGSVSFTLSRSSGAVAQTVYVSTTMTEGFTNSSDYTGRDNVAQVFAVGETSKTITINITNDTIVEPDETFGLIVQQNAADPLGTYLSKATFTITNDDSAAAVTYSFTPATRSINEGAGSVSFTLSRSSGAVAQTVYVSTTMTEGFTNSSDYTGRDNVAQVFAVGETSKTITINITNDTIVEPDETFGLIVQQNAADPLGTYLSKATFTITNDDSAAAVTYSFTPATRSINEGAGSVSFTLSRSSGAVAQTVYVSTTMTEGFTNSSDYTGRDNVAQVFAVGETSKTITINITNDTIVEPDETFGLIVQQNAADPLGTYLSKATFTITNDDSAAAVTYSFTPATRSINEGAGSVSFTLSRSSGAVAQTVYVSTTMTEGFTNSSDYTGRDNVAQVFAVGETSKTITINITNDTIVEPDETFGLIVQQNAADPLGTYLSKATFTITNDDSAAAVTYSFTPATRSINEGAGSVSFTLSRSSGAVAQTVYVSTTMTEGFTNSSDYTGRDNVAQVFAVGETSKTITINITNDTIVEPDETFGLIVQQNAADPLGTYLSKATFTITNDDSAAAVTLAVNGFGSSYSSSTAPYAPTISLTGIGFNSITQVSWACTNPNGSACAAITPWTPSNWIGKFTVSSDTAASVKPTFIVATDPRGTYSWTVTFTGAGQTVSKTFTVTRN